MLVSRRAAAASVRRRCECARGGYRRAFVAKLRSDRRRNIRSRDRSGIEAHYGSGTGGSASSPGARGVPGLPSLPPPSAETSRPIGVRPVARCRGPDVRLPPGSKPGPGPSGSRRIGRWGHHRSLSLLWASVRRPVPSRSNEPRADRSNRLRTVGRTVAGPSRRPFGPALPPRPPHRDAPVPRSPRPRTGRARRRSVAARASITRTSDPAHKLRPPRRTASLLGRTAARRRTPADSRTAARGPAVAHRPQRGSTPSRTGCDRCSRPRRAAAPDRRRRPPRGHTRRRPDTHPRSMPAPVRAGGCIDRARRRSTNPERSRPVHRRGSRRRARPRGKGPDRPRRRT